MGRGGVGGWWVVREVLGEMLGEVLMEGGVRWMEGEGCGVERCVGGWGVRESDGEGKGRVGRGGGRVGWKGRVGRGGEREGVGGEG